MSSVWIFQAIFLVICPKYLSDTKKRVVSALPLLSYHALQTAAVPLPKHLPRSGFSLYFGGWPWSCFYSYILVSVTFMADPQSRQNQNTLEDMSSFSKTSEYKHHQQIMKPQLSQCYHNSDYFAKRKPKTLPGK